MAPILFTLLAMQMPQNPSPMVETTRDHDRPMPPVPAGRRIPVDLGTLYIPAGSRHELLVFFHGGQPMPEAAGAENKQSVITIQLGPSSDSYVEAFQDQSRFLRLLDQAKTKSGMTCDMPKSTPPSDLKSGNSPLPTALNGRMMRY